MDTAIVEEPPRERSRVIIGVAVLMLVEAASLGVASGLHLLGLVHGRSSSFNPDAAGIAEAIIGSILALAAVLMLRSPARYRRIGVAATAFALIGFLVGIGETTTGGHAPDITFHAVVIPLLVTGLMLLIRSGGAVAR
jgi:peptidoglycan/LPS O-acetylase OafA/YrhL